MQIFDKRMEDRIEIYIEHGNKNKLKTVKQTIIKREPRGTWLKTTLGFTLESMGSLMNSNNGKNTHHPTAIFFDMKKDRKHVQCDRTRINNELTCFYKLMKLRSSFFRSSFFLLLFTWIWKVLLFRTLLE